MDWVALLVSRYLSNAASFVLCVLRRVKDHHTVLHYSPRLKNICVRQVALDKWLPPDGFGAAADLSWVSRARGFPFHMKLYDKYRIPKNNTNIIFQWISFEKEIPSSWTSPVLLSGEADARLAFRSTD